jgi:hypothetical protein
MRREGKNADPARRTKADYPWVTFISLAELDDSAVFTKASSFMKIILQHLVKMLEFP